MTRFVAPAVISIALFAAPSAAAQPKEAKTEAKDAKTSDEGSKTDVKEAKADTKTAADKTSANLVAEDEVTKKRPTKKRAAPKREPEEELDEEAETTSPVTIPLGVWISGGVAVAFGIGAAVTGGLALGKRSDFNAINDGRDPVRAENLKSSGEILSIATDVLTGAAIATVGVGAILFFSQGEEEIGVRVTPVVTTAGAAALLTGTF